MADPWSSSPLDENKEHWFIRLMKEIASQPTALGRESWIEPTPEYLEALEEQKKKRKVDERGENFAGKQYGYETPEDLWRAMQTEAAGTQIERGTPTVFPGVSPFLRGQPSEDYVPYREGINAEPAPYPQEGGYAQDEIWSKFRAMNPDLDYEAVARQAGGNVPGGNFSAMESTVNTRMTDDEYAKFVEDENYKFQLNRMLDPRSRSYDSTAAKLLMDQRASARDADVREIYNRAQMLQARAAQRQVELAQEAMAQENTPIGRARALTSMMVQNLDPYDPNSGAIVRATLMLNSDDPKMQQQGLEILNSLQYGQVAQQQANTSGKPVG